MQGESPSLLIWFIEANARLSTPPSVCRKWCRSSDTHLQKKVHIQKKEYWGRHVQSDQEHPGQINRLIQSTNRITTISRPCKMTGAWSRAAGLLFTLRWTVTHSSRCLLRTLWQLCSGKHTRKPAPYWETEYSAPEGMQEVLKLTGPEFRNLMSYQYRQITHNTPYC